MFIFLNKVVNNAEEYMKIMKKINSDKMFNKTITINGNTSKISNFFNSSGKMYKYYHMVQGDKQYFAKLVNGKGILIVIEKANNVAVSTTSSFSKEWSKDRLNNLISSCQIATDDE